jgi:hypothetical protein
LGIYFFYLLVQKFFDKHTAFYSSILLIVSIWFQFSRKIMPDSFSCSLVLAAMYFGIQFLQGKGRMYIQLFLYFLLATVGVLSKLPAGYMLVLIGLLLFDKEIPISRKVLFISVSSVAFLGVAVWYFYWVPYLVDTYGFWHFFMGKSIAQGTLEIMDNLPQTFNRFYETAMHLSGFALFLLGLFWATKRHRYIVLLVVGLSVLTFLFIILKAGYTFPHHSYYVIPFVPVMAMTAGYGLTQIKYAWLVWLLLFTVIIEGMISQEYDFRVKEREMRVMNLERDLDKISKRSDLILMNSEGFPTPMYFAHRKGWVESSEKVKDPTFVKNLQRKGLKFVVILKRSFGTEIFLDNYSKVLENEDYCIYQL